MVIDCDVRKGGRIMAVLAIRKPSAYIVKTPDKDKFMNGKSDEASIVAIKSASEKLRRECSISKDKK